MNSKESIGVFDSGIGGLNVVYSLKKILPNEKIIYFGDTKNLPYGNKPPSKIKEFSTKISQFFINKNCKLIVLACNTASALAYDCIKKKIDTQCLLINIIDPVVGYVSKFDKKKITVIGTKNTIYSDTYRKKIIELNNSIKIKSYSTPELVPIIENGFFSNSIDKITLNKSLNKIQNIDYDYLLLGCTHYPLIENKIKLLIKKKIKIINSNKIISKYIYDKLFENKLLNNKIKKNIIEIYYSKYDESFINSAKIFFGNNIKLTKHEI